MDLLAVRNSLSSAHLPWHQVWFGIKPPPNKCDLSSIDGIGALCFGEEVYYVNFGLPSTKSSVRLCLSGL